MKRIKIYILTLILIITVLGVNVSAADQTARLKNSLSYDLIYKAVSIETLDSSWSASTDRFITAYDNLHVAFTGNIVSTSQNTRQLVLYADNGRSITVNTEAYDAASLSPIKKGDRVTVFGYVDVTPVLHSSFKVVAQSIIVNSTVRLVSGSYYAVNGELITGQRINDMAEDGHVAITVPESWTGSYVSSALTNNNIHGHQFALNAISPQNTEFPELFYIFYFDSESHLDKPLTNPDNSDNKKIETAIVKNILQNLDDNFKISIEDFTTRSGKKLHYCMTTYKPADGRDYRLEFVFVPEARGITVMLYLYYPKAGSISHLEEVTRVIEMLEN